MTATKHSTVETNGIRMRVAEEGAGPLVLLCHGFPESWYSWCHQLPGCGHWTEQERADEVNAAMIAFLKEL